ncbi:hypothetical protein [Streptomyces clavuligerus]|uniref:Peptidase inhibitor family I36 n=1 Tax=Streptomyces clavuligerus TaxID=1901 RepID=D5SIM4_STRCL|nr:hypothetical protein [Streptomyces clavuligerus]EFG03767.1 Hypothetical protein SCLAV_p0276 [Streptomyces clavuligerus]MBY6307701.1 hypothetical protein [Streptomyces clavuligerus]QPJ98203.1 hypothetical protein GE265_34925 [Streptomyces clavuligerus]WDN56459.1 hypothetical protein LL058_31975 [Streptomyces clavuligerus]
MTARRIRSRAAVLAAVLTAAFTCAGTTTAQPPPPPQLNPPGIHILNEEVEYGPGCPGGWLCVFETSDYRYASFALLPGVDVADVSRLRNRWVKPYDRFQSWSNNTLLTYCAYPNPGFFGPETTLAPGASANLTFKSFRVC